MRCKKYAILVAALFPLTAAAFPSTLFAITDNWTDGNGNWNTPANWSANLPPAAGDTVNIAFSSGASRTVTYDYTGANITLASLTIDLSGVAFTNAILTQAANNLFATTETIGAGSISPSDGGIFNQSGGTNTTATLFFGSTTNGKGSYNLSGSGTLTTTATEYLGYNGSGTFTQSGGTHIISGGGNSFFIGYNANAVGSYSLTAGSLAVTGYEIIGYLGTGSMNQSGGTHTVAAGYYFSLGSGGGTGSYTLGGTGSLTSSSSEYIGSNGSGTFTQTGGTNTITPGNFLVIANLPGSTGNYTLSAGTATINGNAYVGGGNTTAGGTGALNIQSGAMTVVGTLKIWNTPNSAVNFSGGSLTINALDTSSNPAHFNWTAGSLTLNNDLLQNNTASSTFPNSFALNANQSLSVQNAYIGDTGTGAFTQNGGTLTVNNINGLIIGGRTAADSSAVGTYNFNGGTIANTNNNPVLVGSYGHGTFNQTAGNLSLIAIYVGYYAGSVGTVNQSGGSLTSPNSLLVGGGGTGAYNLSAGNLSPNDAYVGFDVTGFGTLTQTGGSFSVQNNLQLAFTPGSTGIYNLSAGSLTVPATLTVGVSGAGTFTQTGGTVNVAAQNGLVITRNAGSSGNYTLSGTGVATFIGNASVGGDMFNPGGAGLLNIQAGAMTVVGTLKVWNNSTNAINLSGGSLTVGALDVNSNPVRFHWTAGSLTINNFVFFATGPAITEPFGNSLTLNASQSLTLTSTGNNYENLGVAGSLITQNGGNNTAPSVFIGNTPGPGTPATYSLNAGNLTIANYEAVASGSPIIGIFNQTGGTNITGALILGDTPGSTGTFNLSGGTANITISASLGSISGLPGGAGILNIQGGAMTVATLNLYDSPGTALNLTGGSLTINTLNTFGNPSRFSWTGGTLNLISFLIDTSGPVGASLSLTPGKILNNIGTLTNNGSLALAGGSLSSTGPILNNTSLSGFGTIAGTFGITNNGLITHAGGNLLISNTGLFTNNANMQLAPGYLLQLTGGNLTNFGFLDIHGATVTGTAALINNPSGTIAGSGAILTPFTNAGLITLDAGNLQLPSFTNNGTIELAGPSASIGPSGTITNAANIEGHGKISMAVINNTTIEATGGTLILTGTLTNSPTGTLRTASGTKILLQSATTLTNAGLIDLAGGTLDTSNQPLINTNQITGFGILSTGSAGGLTNNGALTFTGGTTTINGPVTNATGKTILAKNFPTIFTGNITNNGTIKTTNTTVTFTANYTGNAYISDPSTNIFQANATTLPGGLMTGSTGDVFLFNTFTNNGTFTNGGDLSVSTSITNTATFSQSGPQSWSPGATFTNTSGTATFLSNAKLYGITITAGTVDITNSKFIIEPTSKSTALATLRQNITTHSLIASNMPSNFGLALLDNALLNKPTFGGQQSDTNSLLLSIELLGDANADGIVNTLDLQTVLNNFGTTTGAWTSGNFDNTPTINLTDLADVLNNFGLTNPNASNILASSSESVATPEPTSFSLLGCAATLLLVNRRRPIAG